MYSAYHVCIISTQKTTRNKACNSAVRRSTIFLSYIWPSRLCTLLVAVRYNDPGTFSCLAYSPVLFYTPTAYLPLSWATLAKRISSGRHLVSRWLSTIINTPVIHYCLGWFGTEHQWPQIPHGFLKQYIMVCVSM